MNKREQIIRDYCKAGRLYFLEPWEVADSTELFKEYDITKDDFVKIISESPYEAIFIGLEIWKPRFEFTEEEYNKVLKREQKKIQVWDNLFSLPEEFRNKIEEEISKEDSLTNTWENLDCMVGSAKLFDSLYRKYKNKAK
ncbi:hypothetical protein ACSW8L_16215 (plasmid) [Clostridium perfringens]